MTNVMKTNITYNLCDALVTMTTLTITDLVMTARVLRCEGNVSATVAVWQVRNSTVQVRQGDELSVTCVVTSLTPIDVVRLILRRPRHSSESPTASIPSVHFTSNGNSSVLSWVVADNYDVKEPFSSLPRYRLYYSYKDGIATSTLTYRGIYSRPHHRQRIVSSIWPQNYDLFHSLYNND